MRIFLDTASVDEIRQAVGLGVVSGITTNPSLLAKEKRADFKAVVQEICSLVKGPVSAEVTSLETEGMVREAREIGNWAPNVVVKVPMSAAGLRAVRVLSQEKVQTNMTLVFSTNQALLAAQSGATFISPFVGRLDDIGQDGMKLVEEIMSIYRSYGLGPQVIAASIRHPQHCVAAAKAGAHIATVPYGVLMQMINHPLTDIGITRFAQDWQKLTKA